MELYFFPHIESVRILPFTKKKKISVPASQIEKYIDNIVIPIARYHEITTQGLNIIEETYACEAVLSLEDTITTNRCCGLASVMETSHLLPTP